MPVFQYTARNEEGQLVQETIAFQDVTALRRHLRKNNLFLLEVAERRRSAWSFRRGIGLADLIIMTRQLRSMIQAGMPLVTGLEALAEQSTNLSLKEIIQQVGRSVGAGRSLAATLGDYPRIFPEMLVTMVRAGEEGGRLPEALLEASRQLELQMEVRQKLINALIYPCFTLLATIGTVAAMLLFIVPVFAKIYQDLHAALPAPTQMLIWLSDVLVHSSWIVLLILITLAVVVRRYYLTPEGRLMIDGLKLKVPLFGSVFRKTASANLTGALAGLLDSGVPLIQALEIGARVCGNEVMANSIRTAARNVTAGRKLSNELERGEQFPILVVRMIAMAEEVGTLPTVLRQISASYIEEVEYLIRRLLGLVEPIMVLVLGGIVGFVLVALYYPIFNLGNVILGNG